MELGDASRIFTTLPVVPVERSADSQEQMEGVVTESLFTSETLEKPPGTGKPNPLVEILFSPEPPPSPPGTERQEHHSG